MTTSARNALEPYVQARIGRLHVAVPAGWVAGAHASGEPLTALPRHQGAVAGLLATADGCVPVIDLARWVALPTPSDPTADDETALTEPAPCYLTLRQGGQRLAIQVDELLGLRRVGADQVQRLHHRDDPDELFDAVLPGAAPGDPMACVLEPQRLMRLLALWCEDTATHDAAATRVVASQAARAARLALLRTAGRRIAVDMRHIAELMPAPLLKARLAPGGATVGFADWRGGTLAVLHAGWLQGEPSTAASPLSLVLRDESGRAVALPVDELLGMADRPTDTVAPDPGAPAWQGERWTDAGGPVEQVRVPALLDALPESALAQGGARATPDRCATNDRPYFLLQAGRTAALPVDEVLAVVDAGSLSDDQQTLHWRGRELPLRGQPAADGVVVVLQVAGDAVALRAQRLLGLVPAGAAEVSALPGVPGARMLHLPTQAASYAVARADDLVPA